MAEGGIIDALSGPRTVTYQNDAINRLSMIDSNLGLPINFTPNHLNQYTSVTSHGSMNYDGTLNVSGYDGWTFVHDAEKRLLSVTRPGHSGLFIYDGLGRCVKRTIDGATVVVTYDNWKPIVEWEWFAGTSRLVAWNLYGPGADEILVRNQPNTGGYLYYHLDPMGNVQFLLSDTLQGLEKYTYDVFGKPTIKGWQNGEVRSISNYGNRFLFTGREYLYTFGLYDYRLRIYHPGLGRFIETDPLGQQIEGTKLSPQQTALFALGGSAPKKFSASELNLYRYCHNAPVNKSDPLGLYIPQPRGFDEEKTARIKAEVEKIGKSNGYKETFEEWAHDKVERYIDPAKSTDNWKGHEKWNSFIADIERMTKSWWGFDNRGGTAYYDPDNWKTAGGDTRAPIYGLAHELGHMIDAWKGTYGGDGDKAGENRARWFENQVRPENDQRQYK